MEYTQQYQYSQEEYTRLKKIDTDIRELLSKFNTKWRAYVFETFPMIKYTQFSTPWLQIPIITTIKNYAQENGICLIVTISQDTEYKFGCHLTHVRSAIPQLKRLYSRGYFFKEFNFIDLPKIPFSTTRILNDL